LSASLQNDESPVVRLLLREYGAVFVAANGVVPPPVMVFSSEDEVASFQNSLSRKTAEIGGHPLTLQRAAMDDLLFAVEAATLAGASITPRGADSAGRSYSDTVALWHSRVEPALQHWVDQGRLDRRKADEIRRLSPFEQVPEVFELERQGIFFAKDLSKSIIYSVAPPGASQHLSLLAFDMKEFDDPTSRSIMNRHGWFQTVVSDLPHFTYLGAREDQLHGLGLRRADKDGRAFWIPEL